MKLTVPFVLVACLQVSAHVVDAQRITYAEKNVSLEKVFNAIRKQTGYEFLYNTTMLGWAKKEDLKFSDTPLKVALDGLFKNQPLTYTIVGKTIVVKRKKEELSVPASGEILFKEVQGTVVDSTTGEPLVGVTIKVKGSTIGTVTDANGEFSLDVSEGAVLEVSSVGYTSKEVSVNGKSTIQIALSTMATGLNQLVVVGYSSERKKDITGSVAVVDMNAFNSIPTGSASSALQGQASGVTLINSGAPGGHNDIFIRGITSFGNTRPLVIVDGIPGSLDDLNMNNIASIQILKDAGAASIYGVRGSNGVIVVTTKKGSGAPTISYDAYFGIQVPLAGNVFNLLNSKDYAELTKKVNPGSVLFANGLPDFVYAGPSIRGIAMTGDPAINPEKYVFDPANPENDYLIQKVNKSGTDWFHEVFKVAPKQSHTITASGGTSKANYLFSLGYLNQQGTLIETFLKRYSARINTQFNIKNNIKIGENAYFFYKQNPGFDNMSEGNAVSMSYLMSPIIPVYDIMGNFGGTWAGPELGANPTNPVANQKRTVNDRNNTWDVIGNVYAEINFLKHFTARTSFGGTIDHGYSQNFGFNQYNERQGHNGENNYSESSSYNSSYVWTNTLKYNNLFGKYNLVKILIGSEAINNYGRSVGGSSWNFFSTNFNYLILNNGTSNITNYSSAYSNSLFSLFGKLNYSYNDKYLLGVTLRRDGSSLFGSNKKYGLFPSFSLGWRLSKEEFMKKMSFINDLKLRGSYGILGSKANVNPSNAFSLYSTGFGTTDYSISGSLNSVQLGFAQESIGNPNTGWEEDVITDIGFDVTILNNKLNISAEWYKKSINGLLFPLQLPATVGGAIRPTVNIGDIMNKGWDISIIYHGSLSNDFQYKAGLNFTTYKNKVIRIPDPGYFDVADSRIGNIVRNQVGHPVGSFFGYKVIDLFKDSSDVSKSPSQTDAAPGRFKYKDMNGDGKITPADRTFFGNPNPDFTYGVNLALKYKNFDLSGILYGSQGNDLINFVRHYTDFFGSSQGKGKSNVLKNAWTPQNRGAKVPKLELTSSFSTGGVINSYLMEDGSFLKLRSLILGYTLKPIILQKFGLDKLRVYFQAANLFTITRYTGLDPELGSSLSGSHSSASFGIDYGNYPNNEESFLIGINVKF